MGEKFAKLKDENKILVMLAFFSISFYCINKKG